MSYGFSGSTLFLPIYLALGMAWIAFWPLALGDRPSGQHDGGIVLPDFALTVVFHALKSASGLSPVRMLVVNAVILVYIGCFLYLWVG